MKTARQITVEALLKMESGGGYSPIVLNNAIKRSEVSGKDKAFITAMFYGVIERKITLDYYIKKYTKHKLSPVVQEILRLAFYQIIFMDGVPESAAVDQAVELTRLMRQPGAAKLVNGILRTFLRDGMENHSDNDDIQSLEINYSYPKDLISLFVEWYGLEKTKKILTLSTPTMYIRVNTLKNSPDILIKQLEQEGYHFEKTSLDNCLKTIGGDVAFSKAHKKGLFHIQDISSQKAVATLQAKQGERILDLCAAPGSKSFTIAQHMQGIGDVVSCDIHPHKIPLIAFGAQRLGIDIITTKINDATEYNADLGEFDKVLCDVPCSGLGIIGRKPEIKYKPIGSFDSLPEYQYKILKNSTNYLKIGGEIVYSTCTINPYENEHVIERLLKEDSRFESVCLEGGSHFIINLPFEKEGDGFFISKIRRVR